MDHAGTIGARTGALYTDVENLIGGGASVADAAHVRELIEAIVHGLQSRHHIQLRRVWATARTQLKRGERKLSPSEYDLTYELRAIGCKMDWCWDKTADENLIRKVENTLAAGVLEETFVLASSDEDFVPLLQRVKETRRFTVVIGGTGISKRLAKIADLTLRLPDLDEVPRIQQLRA